jgi:tetratricopeptide (TPR) repeat protein
MRQIYSQRWKVILLGLGLSLFVVFTYLPVLHNDFIFYDDPGYVTENPYVQSGLTWEGFKWAWRSTDGGNWNPLTWLSHMLDGQLFGLKPWGHHLTNLLLHAVNTGLVFLVLQAMTGAVWRSLFVAVMFGLHPVHVESVAWVSERKGVLCATFSLLSLWCYHRYARREPEPPGRAAEAGSRPLLPPAPGMTYYWLALLFFALGLMAKPMLVTMPFVLLLLDYWPLNRFRNRNDLKLVVEKVPFLLLSIAICVITIPAQKMAGGVRTIATFPLTVRLENALVSYCRYLGKFFWPANLPFFYPHPGHWPLAEVLAASLLLLAVFVCAWMIRRNHPYFLTGWCWYLGTLVPMIGLVQVGFQSIANRYTYVPSIGIFIALAWGACALTQRWRHQAYVLGALAAAALVICIPLTRIQIGYWKDSEILFQYASVVIKNNWVAHGRLGLVFSKQGRVDDAIREYREALRLNPDDADTHYDLANALCRKRLWDEAVSQYREDLRLNPDDAAGHNNLGVALFQKGKLPDAVSEFEAALRLKPDYPEASRNLAAAMRALNAPAAPATPGRNPASTSPPGR